MTTPDEQEQGRTADDAAPVAPDLPVEASEADVLEQATEAGPVGVAGAGVDLPLEASEADVVEQAQEVPLDEDEHPV